MTEPVLLMVMAALLSLAMSAVWTVAKRPGKAGWTDAVWSYATGAVAAIGALAPLHGPPGARQWLVAAMALAWGLRLGTHIAARNRKDADDPRYAALKAQWGADFAQRLFTFLQVQALCGWVLAASAMAAARASDAPLQWSDWLGAAILAAAIAGEGEADRQLARFRADRANRGKVADTGLWGLSRHPNYFFEWLGWCAYPVIAILAHWNSVWSWTALAGPVLIYWLLVHASGIPPLEKHMLKSRPEAFRAYQKRVRAFWPIPK